MTQKQVINLLKIIISLGLIFFILRLVDFNQLLYVLRNADFAWLSAAVGLMFLGIVIRAWRWKILLDSIQVIVPLYELVNIYFIGFLFNNLLPTGLGGDPIRMLELNRHSGRASHAVTSVLVDRMLGLLALLSIVLLALLFRWDAVPSEVALTSIALISSLIGASVFLINRPLYRAFRRISLVRQATDIKFMHNIFNSFQAYRLVDLGRSYLVSILFNIILIMMIMSLGLALGAQVELVHYLVFIPITAVVLLLPLGWGGLGPREVTYIYLFGQIGVPEEISLGLSLLVYAIGNFLPGLIGGIIYLWRGART